MAARKRVVAVSVTGVSGPAGLTRDVAPINSRGSGFCACASSPSNARRTARRLLWARSMAARENAPMQWCASGRDTRCRGSRKATQDNQTPGRATRGFSHFLPGAPWVPVRAAVANAPGGGGWIPVPISGRQVHPRFCWWEEGFGIGTRVFGSGIANYGTHNSARALSEYRHHGAH